MHQIFLSYRRDDSGGWASRLFEHLAQRVGAEVLFMDIEGGIARGQDFEAVLRQALESCSVLLAVIGPRWMELKRGDQRRIDLEDDWVRLEILSGLRRQIPVVPVLVGRAGVLSADLLPDALKPLARQQAASLRDDSWAADFAALLDDVLKQVPALRTRVRQHSIHSARNGFLLLERLLSEVPQFTARITLFQASIATAYAQIQRIEQLKAMHDALHAVEHECLRPLQVSKGGVPIRPYQFQFARAARRAREAVKEGQRTQALKLERELLLDIEEGLSRVEAAFAALIAAGPSAPIDALLAALMELIGRYAPELNRAIEHAAASMDLDRLAELMQSIASSLDAGTLDAANDVRASRLRELQSSMVALASVRDELKLRVEEHALLQGLDRELRALDFEAETTPQKMAAVWARVRRKRERLGDNPTPELAPPLAYLDELGTELEVGLAAAADVREILREYFRALASAFKDVDAALKELCGELADIGVPLKLVLELLEQAA